MDTSSKVKLVVAVLYFSIAAQVLAIAALAVKAAQSNCVRDAPRQTWITKEQFMKETLLGRAITALSEKKETESLKESLSEQPEAKR